MMMMMKKKMKMILKSLKSLPPLGLYLILILGLGYGFLVNGFFELIFCGFWV